jgi:hypothetical protein
MPFNQQLFMNTQPMQLQPTAKQLNNNKLTQTICSISIKPSTKPTTTTCCSART